MDRILKITTASLTVHSLCACSPQESNDGTFGDDGNSLAGAHLVRVKLVSGKVF